MTRLLAIIVALFPAVATAQFPTRPSGGGGAPIAGTGISVAGSTVSINTATTVDKTTAQTLTNKTLTAPVLGGTVTGTYTLGGTLTLTAPTLTGTITTSGLLTGSAAGGGGTYGHIVDTTNATAFISDWRSQGASQLKLYAGGALVTTNGIYDPTLNCGYAPTGSTSRIYCNLLPSAAGAASSGSAAVQWSASYAYAYFAKAQTPAFGATMNIDPSLGEQVTVTLTGSLTNWTISAPLSAGAHFVLTFTQDATGLRLIGTPPAAIHWLPSTYLGSTHVAPVLTVTANKSDSFYFASPDGVNWIEIERNMNN